MGESVISLCRGHGEGKVYTDGQANWVTVLLQEESLAMLRRMYGSKDHRTVSRSLCSLVQLYTADSVLLHEEAIVMKRHIHGSKGRQCRAVED